MIEHLVFFKYNEDLDPKIKAQIVNGFKCLMGVIPGLIEVNIGENVTEETHLDQGINIGLRMLFQTHDHLRAYLTHPDHVQLADIVKTSVDNVIVCDFYR